ncbi:MAG TPA: S1/P1 nuclease [Vicinamibacterales bacterium]
MMRSARRAVAAPLLAGLLLVCVNTTGVHAWGAQGHRLVALLATARLTPIARSNVEWLLGPETLADVSSWADRYWEGNYQTYYWHFLNIPPDATSYDRDRDCPRQPRLPENSAADRWRDCAVDRITYAAVRLADVSLDRADRAIALKFLVHLVGDLHQPFHALGVESGGNGIPVSVFGSETCGENAARSFACNLHGVWDSSLIAHRGLDDQHYLTLLDEEIRRDRLDQRPRGTPAEWAMESQKLAKAALLPPHGTVDDVYYRRELPVIDARLAVGGVRLAALINESLTLPPSAR